jgi:hypothetical protein
MHRSPHLASRRRRSRLAALAFGFVLAFLAPSLARADGGETRLAIVVGNNGSTTLGRAELRYADDDAAKYAALFASTSQDGNVELLTRFDADTSRLFPAQALKAAPPTRAALDAAVSRIAARAVAAGQRGERVVLTFVFAGHGDVEEGRGFLELEDGRFFRDDLEALLGRIPATRAHVLLDACNSVYMLVARKPGGTKFTTPEEIERSMAARLAHVGTFVSTSADAQVYEWSRIESGVFSHSVRSGLSGAADLDGDGRVTYGELRAFVRIAAEGVPNARFRPRLYARGPGGRDDEVVFEPRAAGPGKKIVIQPGAERRVTVLDANEVPLVDVKVENGFGPSLYLPVLDTREGSRAFTVVEREEGRPERRVELAPGSEGLLARADTPAGPTARAAGRPFELLFAMPFGPRSVAALPAETPADDVYGVSNDDRERMKRLLEFAAEIARDRRVIEGAGGLAFAGVAGGLAIGAWVTSSDPDTRVTKNIVGGAFMGLSVIGLATSFQLFTPSKMEERRDAYIAALSARPEAIDAAVLEAERELFKREVDARHERYATGAFSMLFGALELAGGVVLLTATDDSDLHWLAGGLLAAGVGSGITGLSHFVVGSEDERIADLWRKERAATDPKLRSSGRRKLIELKPSIGFGSFGLKGTF